MTNKEILFHLVYSFIWGSLLYWVAETAMSPLTIFTCVLAAGAAAIQFDYLITSAAERF